MSLTSRKILSNKSLIYRACHKVYRDFWEAPKRERIRKRVLALKPHTISKLRDNLSIHSLICSRDVDMLICSQRSLYQVSEFGNTPLILHDDGSLSDQDAKLIQTKLPNAKVVLRPEADRTAEEKLANYPNILEYRKNQVMALKLVDVKIWAKGTRTLYVDSDIAFFSPPNELIESSQASENGNFFNKDLADSYVVPRSEIIDELGFGPKEAVNAGLWGMDTTVIDLDKIEAWLQLPIFNKRPHYYTLDQTFISMLANISAEGCEYFSPEYDVNLRKQPEKCCVKHYVGEIRHGFELEGLQYLLREKNLENTWDSKSLSN